MFGSYRRGDANDADLYVASIAAVLSIETYVLDVIRRATDPRTGIQTIEKFRTFMPNAGELKAYLDEQQAIAERYQHYAALPAPAQRPSRPRAVNFANVFVSKFAPQYTKMVEKSQSEVDRREWCMDEQGRGIWVVMGWL